MSLFFPTNKNLIQVWVCTEMNQAHYINDFLAVQCTCCIISNVNIPTVTAIIGATDFAERRNPQILITVIGK